MDFLEPVHETPPWKLTLLKKLKQRDEVSAHLLQVLKQLETATKKNIEYHKKIYEMEKTLTIISKRSKKLLNNNMFTSSYSGPEIASITESTIMNIKDEEIVKHIAYLQSRLNNSNELNKELERKNKELHQKYLNLKSETEKTQESRESILNRIKILEDELKYTRKKVCDIFDENIALQLENSVMLSKI
jgi:chromosome segregation ATPase